MFESSKWLIRPQRRLGVMGSIVFLALTVIINALSFDMYTPALPTMVTALDASDQLVNLTMVCFFAVNTLSLLIGGPISDKLGRKPLLIFCSVLYTLGSVICALSPNIAMLIAGRVVQALGSGTVAAVGTAITKDIFVPQRRELALSVVQTTFVVGPVVAPVIGAAILNVMNWHGIFWALGVFGLVMVALSSLLEEPLPAEERNGESVLKNLGHLGSLVVDKKFIFFLFVVSSFNFAFSGYIAVGSHIYIEQFNTSTFGFSLFFAINAIICGCGPAFYLTVGKRLSVRAYTTAALTVAFAAGVAMIVVGPHSKWSFLLLFCVFSMMQGSTRPYSTNILLTRRSGDVGAASSLINFVHSFCGVIGMTLVVAPVFPNYVVAVGSFMAGMVGLGLVIWFVLCRKGVLPHGV